MRLLRTHPLHSLAEVKSFLCRLRRQRKLIAEPFYFHRLVFVYWREALRENCARTRTTRVSTPVFVMCFLRKINARKVRRVCWPSAKRFPRSCVILHGSLRIFPQPRTRSALHLHKGRAEFKAQASAPQPDRGAFSSGRC